MKFIPLFLLLIFLSQISPEYGQSGDGIDYVNLALRIFESLEAECYPELHGA